MGHNPQFAANVTPASVAVAASGGHLNIYDGTQPAGPAVAVSSQRLLATLSVPSFGAPITTAGQVSVAANPIMPVKAQLTGTATWFRVVKTDGTPVFDGTADGAGSDLILAPSAFIAAGVTVTVASLTISGQAGQNVTGTGAVAVPSPTPAPAPGAPSGYAGTEPVSPVPALTWCGYQWETENWGTPNATGSPNAPAAANVMVDANGYLNLSWASLPAGPNGAGFYGSEIDSVRGDASITGNPSRWGYGTYRWVIGTDMAAIDPALVLGLFSYWAYGSPTSVPPNPYGKGGPHGNTEIDMEISNWLPEGARTPGTFFQMGYYQDDPGGVTAGVPTTNGALTHTMTTGSQVPVPAGHPVTTMQFTWLPASITWSVWYGTIITGPPDVTLTMTEGQAYTYTEPYGGNEFTGTVHIPKAGSHQVIANLWSQSASSLPAQVTVILRSFAYIPSA